MFTRSMLHCLSWVSLMALSLYIALAPRPAWAEISFSEEFEDAFVALPPADFCDLGADARPGGENTGWTRVETFNDCNEASEIGAVDDNGSQVLFVRRRGGGGSSDRTELFHSLDIPFRRDLREGLWLSLDVKVISHNLEGGGTANPAVDWPARVVVEYENGSSDFGSIRHGWYLSEPGDGRDVDPCPETPTGVCTDEAVPAGDWASVVVPLHQLLPHTYQRITGLWIGGSGWDFESRFDNLKIGFVPLVVGDSNIDSAVNIADPIRLLNILFASGDVPECFGSSARLSVAGKRQLDWNDDGSVNIADAVAALNNLFAGGTRHTLSFFGRCAPFPPNCAAESRCEE